MLQSLGRKGSIDDRGAGYGQVIVDECHHLSAFSYERILGEAKARYVLGLTATPQRRDGHHPIVEMQLGPVAARWPDRYPRARLLRGFDGGRQWAARLVDSRSVTRLSTFEGATLGR